jgi:acyl-CoA thioester hydrolase
MLPSFAKQFLAGWRCMDFNAHMANTAYLDMAADVRFAFLAEHGLPASEFRRLGVGPVVRRDEIEYFREIGLHASVTVTYAIAGLSDDGARWIVENEFFSENAVRCATLRSTGGWLDLRARKLVAPPPELRAIIQHAPRTPDFRVLSGGSQ